MRSPVCLDPKITKAREHLDQLIAIISQNALTPALALAIVPTQPESDEGLFLWFGGEEIVDLEQAVGDLTARIHESLEQRKRLSSRHFFEVIREAGNPFRNMLDEIGSFAGTGRDYVILVLPSAEDDFSMVVTLNDHFASDSDEMITLLELVARRLCQFVPT